MGGGGGGEEGGGVVLVRLRTLGCQLNQFFSHSLVTGKALGEIKVRA